MPVKGEKSSKRKTDEGLGIFINPRTDFGFKRILNNTKMLVSFFKSTGIEEKLGHPVELEKYLSVEQFGESWVERVVITDIRGKLATCEHFLIEMQNAEPKNFIERLLFYSTYLLRCQSPDRRRKGQKQAEDGQLWNYDLKAIFIIAIVNFPMIKSEKAKNTVIDWVRLMHEDTKDVYSDKLNFVIIDLTKFNKTEEELETHTDFWLYTLKYAEMLSQCPEKVKDDEIFSELYDILRTNKLTPEEMKAYGEKVLTKESVSLFMTDNALKEGMEKGMEKGMRKGIRKGMKAGREAGRNEVIFKVVINANGKGIPVEEIADMTDLTVKQVHAILQTGKN